MIWTGWTDNPVMDEMKNSNEREKAIEESPVCDVCDAVIWQDRYFKIGGKCYCEQCVEVCYQ